VTRPALTSWRNEQIVKGQSGSGRRPHQRLTSPLTIIGSPPQPLRDVELFAAVQENIILAHIDPNHAKNDMFHQVIADGMWGPAPISTVSGTEQPRPSTINVDLCLRLLGPVGLGDVVTASVTTHEKHSERQRIIFECPCINQAGDMVISGDAVQFAPTAKRPPLPAVARPVDDKTIGGAVQATVAGLRPGRLRLGICPDLDHREWQDDVADFPGVGPHCGHRTAPAAAKAAGA